MPKLISILLILGVIVLLGLGWAARSETAYYLFYHLRDLMGDLFGSWATPKSSKLIDEGPFPPRMNKWIRQVRMAVTGLWSPCQPTPEEVVCELVAMQAQEHPYARWSVAQRVEPTADAATVFDQQGELGQIHFRAMPEQHL